MLSVHEVIMEHKSGLCTVEAYFYSQGGESPKAFIMDSQEGHSAEIITLPSSIIDAIIEQDGTFGISVGGIYSYYAMKAIVNGYIIFKDNKACFEKVDEIILSENELTQSFFFSF